MNYTNELYSWAFQLLLILGVLLIPVGLGFMFVPDRIFKVASRLNCWIATDVLFNKINAPVYKERFFYRHHQTAGIAIIIFSSACLYMLTSYLEIETITAYLLLLAESELEKWLFVNLYYLLVAALFFAFLFGIVMFMRPSALKSFEEWSNRWVDTDGALKILDKNKDLPDKILSGNPRFFGFMVTMAAIYIIWSVYPE
jgi:hypothetical protein